MTTFTKSQKRMTLLRVVIGMLFMFSALPAGADDDETKARDPNLEHPADIVTVSRGGYSVSALVTRHPRAKAIKHGIALFPGHPGILKLSEQNGQPRYDMKGNFLVRSRRHWLDEETLVAVIDAPSDQWKSFTQTFRETARYGEDVKAILDEIGRRYAVKDWTLVGTSEGSVSAFHAARMNASLANRLILTSSLVSPSRHGPGLSGASWEDLRVPLLWVHHASDPCQFTAYQDVKRLAERTGAALVTVRGGGPGSGHPCEARTAHGFVGIERETVLAMRSWVKSRVVPADIGP